MIFKLAIEQNQVGRLIGHKGQTIKNLQQELNVKISINKDYISEDGKREAEFSADNQADIDHAVQTVKERFLSDNNNFNRQRNDNFGQQRNSGQQQRNYVQRDFSNNQNRMHYEDNNNRQNFNVKRPINNDWDDTDLKGSAAAPFSNATESKKVDDWEQSEVEMSQNQPSKNVYTSSGVSDDWKDDKPKSNFSSGNAGGFEKKFRPRDNDQSTYTAGNRIPFRNFTENPSMPSSNNNNDTYEPIDWDKINAEAEVARKARWSKCPLMLKDFYREHPATTALPQEEVDKFRLENNKITVSRVFDEAADPKTMPKPITKFEYAFTAWPDIMNEITKNGFEKPSPIQSQMWPILLKGEDCIGIAQTGTGKTLAFLLPALIHTDGQPHPRGIKARGGPNVLVLAPTRELAIQIEKEVAKYQFRGIRAVCLYGGNDRKKQIEVIESGVEVIIATPGRLNDLVAANHVKIESITYLILDEADRMLDMGFEPQIRKLLLDIRDDRQTVMTSATWPAGVRRLASSYMKNPFQVVVGSLDLAATHTVTQIIEILDEDSKFERVIKFVTEEMKPEDKAIIFCGKKDRADSLSCDFVLRGIKCQAIHGNREQCDREQALEDIKSGEVKILIATDVASRGIDIQDITAVINYDFPRNIEEYVHRVGRTGRAGRSGTSLSFMTRSDWGSAKELIEIMTEANQEVPPGLVEMADRFRIKKERDASDRAAGIFRGGRGGGGNRGGGGGGNRRW